MAGDRSLVAGSGRPLAATGGRLVCRCASRPVVAAEAAPGRSTAWPVGSPLPAAPGPPAARRVARAAPVTGPEHDRVGAADDHPARRCRPGEEVLGLGPVSGLIVLRAGHRAAIGGYRGAQPVEQAAQAAARWLVDVGAVAGGRCPAHPHPLGAAAMTPRSRNGTPSRTATRRTHHRAAGTVQRGDRHHRRLPGCEGWGYAMRASSAPEGRGSVPDRSQGHPSLGRRQCFSSPFRNPRPRPEERSAPERATPCGRLAGSPP